MKDADFEWDDDKAERNAADHDGVTFEEAQQAFSDPHRIDLYDEDHSTAEEQRFICLGLTAKGLLFVSYRMSGERTRIIHARKASRALERVYEEERAEE